MSAARIDGKAFAQGLRERVAAGVAAFVAATGRKPGLAVVLVAYPPTARWRAALTSISAAMAAITPANASSSACHWRISPAGATGVMTVSCPSRRTAFTEHRMSSKTWFRAHMSEGL